MLPQDQRDALTVKMGQMLNDGGRMFVNVRGSDVRNASSKVAIDEANMEYYISNTGSYQKGFTKKELVAYLSDALGDGYTVVGTNKFGAVSAVVTKKPSSAVRYSRQQAYWKPKLNNAEWNLLNNSTAVEIGSKSKFLDEATKWLYAKKKGTEVFALYGIGDGTVPTVLYASGGEKAASDLARFTSFLKEYDYGTVTYAKTAVRWAEIVSSIKRSMYGDYDAYGHRRKTLELDGILAEASKRLGRRDNDASAKDNDGIDFSREPETLNELRRQNRELKKRVDYWKGQTQRTKVKTVRQSDVNRLAREVIDMSESDLKPQDITERLSKLGEGYFPENIINPADQLERIAEVLDGTAPRYRKKT